MDEKVTINDYALEAPFCNDNAGFSRWTFGTRDGETYFIKEYLTPVYPMEPTLTSETREKRIEACRKFEEEHVRLCSAANDAADGNLIPITEFFRYGPRYYIATRKVVDEKLSPEAFSLLPYREKCYTVLALCHSVMCLHEKGIVHADLKPENILMEKLQGGGMAPRLVDLGSAFFEKEPPESSASLEGDQVYMSPEAVMFICGEEADLTCAMDVFSMGLLIHYYMTGRLPGYGSEYFYPNEAVLDGQRLVLDESLPGDFRELTESMLEAEPERRPSMQEVCSRIREIMGLHMPEEDEKPSEISEPEDKEEIIEISKIPESGAVSGGWFRKAGDL